MSRTFKQMMTLVGAQAIGLTFSASAWAQVQDGMDPTPEQLEQMMAAGGDEMQTFALMVQMGMMLVFMLGLSAVLLVAKRNMKGWNQPIKWVWFSFQGRLNRKAYWLKGQVPLMMINFGLQVFLTLVTLLAFMGTGAAILGGITALVILLPFMIFSMWVGLAISAKRFHDLGSSAWWILGFLIPFYNLWLAIKIMFFRGTPGPNDYGPDPIDEIDAYIEELTGGSSGDDDDSDEDGEKVVQPKPRVPEGPTEPQGFGSRKFGFEEPKADASLSEPGIEVEDLPGGDANLDVIKRRLGDDIMRPIKRKGGGGRPPEA